MATKSNPTTGGMTSAGAAPSDHRSPGNPTTGGLVPANAGLDPSTGLPWEAAPVDEPPEIQSVRKGGK